MPSIAKFNEKKIDFSLLKRLLVQSFSPSNSGNRPYPSAGALYPIEPFVFLFPERIDHFEDNKPGCYHFRAVSKQLQLIKPKLMPYFFDKLILYVVNLSKAIFKYRYRGYRHALMEVGSMYQQATICSQEMGLKNTVWSTFSDQEMLYALDLDHGSYLPMTMQFFGYGDA